MAERLKLRAEDEEDLRTISAILQDALVPVSEMAFLREERRFALVANRFRWECENGAPNAEDGGEAGGPLFERILTGLCFEGVSAVRLKNIDRRRGSRILELLHLGWVPGCLTLTFAGGAGRCAARNSASQMLNSSRSTPAERSVFRRSGINWRLW